MSFVETKCSLTCGIKCIDKVTVTKTEIHNHKGCDTKSFLLLGSNITTHLPVQQFPPVSFCGNKYANWLDQIGFSKRKILVLLHWYYIILVALWMRRYQINSSDSEKSHSSSLNKARFLKVIRTFRLAGVSWQNDVVHCDVTLCASSSNRLKLQLWSRTNVPRHLDYDSLQKWKLWY